MKRLSIDFDNNCLCIMMPGQQGTELVPGIKKEDFESFIPEKYRDKDSFTWDFETETISVNQPYTAEKNFMTKECFIPQVVEPMPKLGKKFDKFTKLLGMETVNLADEIRKDRPEVARLFGL